MKRTEPAIKKSAPDAKNVVIIGGLVQFGLLGMAAAQAHDEHERQA